MIKSPLRYPGGKSRAAAIIASLAPQFNEFREPFVGGGSVFLQLKQTLPEKKYHINDLNTSLITFWRMCQRDVHAVIYTVNKWRSAFTEGKELHTFLKNNFTVFNETETAAAFFIFNRITFSGTTESGGYSEQAYRGRFTESSIERLKAFSMLIAGTGIGNTDYQDTIDMDGTDVFLFLDPPYYSATKSALYGKNGNLHKGFDHLRFAEVMKTCTHKWLITYDDSPYIRDLFSFAEIVPWNITYGMRNVTEGSDQIGRELLIANYPIHIPHSKEHEQQLSLLC